MSAELVLLACLAALAFAFILVAVSNVAFYLRLKRYESDIWIALGSPMPGVNLDSRNFANVRRFLASQGHLSLRDRRSAKLGSFVALTDRIFLGTIAVAVLIVGYIVFFVKP